jgi:hypothetical protein
VFNVCPQCGEYSVEKTIDPPGSFAICLFCHYAHPFLRQPLFIITGASGTGKAAVCLALVSVLKECVVLESDILWGILPTSEQNDYRDYYNTWLRLERVRKGQRSHSPLLGFQRLLEPPGGESAANSDETICRFCLKRLVRPKQPIHANRPREPFRTRSREARENISLTLDHFCQCGAEALNLLLGVVVMHRGAHHARQTARRQIEQR